MTREFDQAELKDILQLLQQLEYCKWDGGVKVCPICGENFGKYGHASDCRLAMTISSLLDVCGT